MAIGASELVTGVGGGQMRVAYIHAIPHSAATATEDVALFSIPHAGRLRAVYFVPLADVTGANTNSTTLDVINRGAAGAGTTSLGTLTLVSGTNLTGKTPNTVVSGLTTALADGDTIALNATKVGTGLDVPSGTVLFVYDGGA